MSISVIVMYLGLVGADLLAPAYKSLEQRLKDTQRAEVQGTSFIPGCDLNDEILNLSTTVMLQWNEIWEVLHKEMTSI
jgi:hypothetical protein